MLEGRMEDDNMLGDEIIQEALKSGNDLRDYSNNIEEKLKKVGVKSLILVWYLSGDRNSGSRSSFST